MLKLSTDISLARWVRLRACWTGRYGHGSPSAFTLVELLVVIGIIGVLMGILLPCFGSAMSLARRAECISNIRSLGFAARAYSNDTDYYPPAWVDSNCRWMDLIKSYAQKKSGLYRCPSDTKQQAVTWDPEIVLSYGINTFRFKDNDHSFWYSVKAREVARPSATILFADCTPGLYYVGGGSTFKDPVNHVDYRHLKGFCTAYADGHAEVKAKTTKLDWDASQ